MPNFLTRQQYFSYKRKLLWEKRLKIARNYLLALHKRGKSEPPTEAQVKLQVMPLTIIDTVPVGADFKLCRWCWETWHIYPDYCNPCAHAVWFLRATLTAGKIEVFEFKPVNQYNQIVSKVKIVCDLTILNRLSWDVCQIIRAYLYFRSGTRSLLAQGSEHSSI